VKRLVLVASTVGVLAVGGCAAEAGPPDNPMGGAAPAPASSVEVDTPALRRLKEQSGVEPCPVTRDVQAAPDGLPAITLPCLGGGRDVHLAGLRGKPTVVNLWASWCTPCRDELPVLQDFYTRAQDKVRMIGVDFEDTRPGAALQLLQQSGVTYPQVADFDKAVDQALGPHPVPMTVLVAADGEVVAKLPIEITSADQLAGLVEQELGVRV
jgi:cytochrome c biogenesis protein CcmG, thiol:disulfide interchange protein DsbE